MLSRRSFLIQSASAGLLLALPDWLLAEGDQKFHLKISLAQWSLHKELFKGDLKALDFPVVARKRFDIEAVEYVSQFFADKAKDTVFLKELKNRCTSNDVKSLLIMIDGEGALASKDAAERAKAVENHYKWVEAAAFLGCHSIRVNLHGEGVTEEEWKKNSADSLTWLSNFAVQHEINVIVENHGGFSSSGKLLAEVMQKVSLPNCGTLPDFGNFCMRREKGDLWESPCVEHYDKYKGVEEMLLYAKGVSAKSYDFDVKGNETTIDYKRMAELVKKSGYQGYIGIEYEGERLSENEGIEATKKLLEKSFK